jgi:two-component system, chemotaxis family, CheB/CheR fusion protein
LIGVTNFFRDPEAFTSLEEQIIPKLFANKPAGSVIRVWTPGCSTGEEAYSIALLLQERSEALRQSFKVQVFATDIDSQAIITARAGLYPASIAADMSPERLAHFFTAELDGSAYRIHKGIRDLLVFSEQDVIKDPPFSKLDFISCRNLLIYMGGDLQKKLIPLFHYALKPGGFLFLGTSETVGDFGDLFTVLDRKLKLYQRKEDVHSTQRAALGRFLPPMMATREEFSRPALVRPTYGEPGGKLPLRELTEQALLEQIISAGALVNLQGDILYLHGRTGLYLEPAPGESGVNNILKMAREGLARELTTALHKAASAKEIVRCPGLRVKTNGDFTRINLTVRPVAAGLATTAEALMYLVILEEAPSERPEEAAAVQAIAGVDGLDADADAHVAALRRELRAKEEYLETANEELETSNEELKSSNEEMQSVNEELQSTNEELETSKEELQSVNEELATVNAELQNKVSDLSRANNDMNNLLAGTGIATIFVDHQLRILRFTPAVTQIINLILSDVGRPVGHIASNLVGYDRLVADTQAVLDTLVPKEIEVQTLAGGWYTTRIRPYRTLDNLIEGAVITFVDITERKQAEQVLRDLINRYEYKLAIAGSHAALWDWDVPNKRIAFSRQWKAARGYAEEEISDRETERSSRIHPDDVSRVLAAVQAHLDGRTPVFAEEYRSRCKDGSWMWIADHGLALRDAAERVLRMAGSETDITGRKLAEEAFGESESRFRQLAESLPQLVWTCRPDGRCDYFSPQWLEFTGVAEAQQAGLAWLDPVHPDDRSALTAAWNAALETGRPFGSELRLRHHSGAYHRFDTRVTPWRDAAGSIVKWFGMHTNAAAHRREDGKATGMA